MAGKVISCILFKCNEMSPCLYRHRIALKDTLKQMTDNKGRCGTPWEITTIRYYA